ncbi:hypothetical protein EI94DRAFT_1580251 [Lactarius quietus]|nr:hypothetical protein EI94DRAFT_1580251 [Lactarius quietus]
MPLPCHVSLPLCRLCLAIAVSFAIPLPCRPPPSLPLPVHTRASPISPFISGHPPHQLRRSTTSTFNSRNSVRCHHAHLRSPARAESSRKGHQSRSLNREQFSRQEHPEKCARDAPRYGQKEKPEFFQTGAGPRGGVCTACLGCHEHTYAKCEGLRLWDGSASATQKNEQGQLVAADGLPICFDWQILRGCSSTSHPDRHRCSGCGRSDHGAQGCPCTEKA